MWPLAACAVFIALLGGCGSEEDAPPKPGHLIAAVGDSITAGSPGWDPDPGRRELLDAHDPKSQWEYWAARDLGDDYEVRNCGVPGDRSDEIAVRLDVCIEGADAVVLQGGVNDLAQGYPPEYAAGNMREMVERVRKAGLPVLVANVLPINRRYPGIRPKITILNRLVDALVRDEGGEVVDFFDTLDDPAHPGRMRAEWAATDGVHPSVEGYKRLGHAVADSLDR